MKYSIKELTKLYKWGDPERETELDENLVTLIKEKSPKAFKQSREYGEVDIKLRKISLNENFINQIKVIAGPENVSDIDFDRIKHTYGRSYADLLKIRLGKISNPPDLIVYPRNEQDITSVLQLCNEYNIPIIPAGGITSVTEGFECKNGGIILNLTKHMNKIIKFHKENSSITVEGGILGPKLEKYLNSLDNSLSQKYTCGHFPQSFEYSSVGGWVATRGAGQESTGYGKIEDMVLGLRIITPSGVIEISDYPARSEGPDIKQIIIGSEGIFGIITSVTLKVWKTYGNGTYHFAMLFKNWTDGLKAVRNTMQARIGKPFVFRLSDPEETDNYIKMAELPAWKDRALNFLGYRNEKRVLLMGTITGEPGYAKFVLRKLKSNLKKEGGFYIGKSVVVNWLKDRFDTPYLRDPLMDNRILIDTLETTCTWENIETVWKMTTDRIKQRPDTISMCHLSHIYENGANLYFVIMSLTTEENELENYLEFQKNIVHTIISSGGSLSHHHGIGRLYIPWMKEKIGDIAIKVLESIKKELDPNNIMNPGVII